MCACAVVCCHNVYLWILNSIVGLTSSHLSHWKMKMFLQLISNYFLFLELWHLSSSLLRVCVFIRSNVFKKCLCKKQIFHFISRSHDEPISIPLWIAPSIKWFVCVCVNERLDFFLPYVGVPKWLQTLRLTSCTFSIRLTFSWHCIFIHLLHFWHSSGFLCLFAFYFFISISLFLSYSFSEIWSRVLIAATMVWSTVTLCKSIAIWIFKCNPSSWRDMVARHLLHNAWWF